MIWDQVAELWTKAVRSPKRPPSSWWRLVRRIDAAAHQLESRSDAELLTAANELRYRACSGETLDRLIPQAFPLVIEAARRHLGLRHFATQILGGVAIQRGCIAEIQTGEGKTLTATLPLFLNALCGESVHLATANDYLARRDADWMRPVYAALGMTVGAITGELSPAQRRAAYACDITYGTAREFGFDFLRDRLSQRTQNGVSAQSFAAMLNLPRGMNSALRNTEQLQRHPLAFVLIDEADSLLIDEARTPLIISSQSQDQAQSTALLCWAAAISDRLRSDECIAEDTERQQRFLTEAGLRRLRSIPKPTALQSLPLSDLADAVVQSVHVAETLRRDEHYVVRDGQVLIVDEYTGRVAEGRKWRNGIHQAVEAREHVPLSPLTQHVARITVQEFFARYARRSGMTGTAISSAFEFWSVYGLPVYQIPTFRLTGRKMLSPRVFPTSSARWDAIVIEVAEMHRSGRPVLIGTRTIEQSERLAERLSSTGLEHRVLNARNPALEAEIVADAGQPHCITVATNMAGRGTDIKLQGDAFERGGLHVICSEPHSSARIDRQLFGRCGRQGDPGSVRQYMSFEDEILTAAWGAERAAEWQQAAEQKSQQQWSMPSGVAVFENAQSIVERQHQLERRMLVTQSRYQLQQLEQLGQDPFLDAVT